MYKVQFPRAKPDNVGEKNFVVLASACAKQCADSICQKTPTSFKKSEFFNDIGQKILFAFYHRIRKIFRFGLPQAEKVWLSPLLLTRTGVQIQPELFGAEDTVAAVAQTRNNVLVFVEFFVQSSAEYLNIRMSVGQSV